MRKTIERLPWVGLCLLAVAAFLLGWRELTPRRMSWAAAPPVNEHATNEAGSERLDPAAWGSDHVDEPLPEYVDIGECLFCHRHEVGADWQTNRHSRTIRDAASKDPAMEAVAHDEQAAALLEEIELVLGGPEAARFLKRGEGYGEAEMLSVGAAAGRGARWRLHHTEEPHWDAERFGERCAGCHTTGVDPEFQGFSALSLECYVCHGDAPLEHSNDATLMPLARERKDAARVVISICGSCHIRFGTSQASGLPYPTNFVAGDNLFRDFQVDFALADDESINPGDRHVLDNVRMVAVEGREAMTCLSCHDVHKSSSKRHRDLPDQAYCIHCHDPDQPKTQHRLYEVHSETCEY